ncbi:MAG: CDP-diacylglycerol diphosphatase [Geminicoccaceae bacterium]
MTPDRTGGRCGRDRAKVAVGGCILRLSAHAGLAAPCQPTAHWRHAGAAAHFVATLGLLGCAATRAETSDPDALWKIVHGRCVPNQRLHGDPSPCTMVELRGGVARGYAVLKDRRGVAQYLLIPTAHTGPQIF